MQEILDSLEDSLGVDLLAALLHIPKTELFLYDSTSESAPSNIADRVCFIAKIVSILDGAYNDEGMRHWFLRKRAQLNGKSPLQIFYCDWSPTDQEPIVVLQLAENINI